MKKKLTIFFLFFILLIFTSCSVNTGLNPKKPITLNIWHNYGGQIKNTMDKMINEFNDTIGLDKGIIINVTSISSSSTLHEKLIMAANDDPDAPKLPDITTAYPNTALILANKNLLADISIQFSNEELSQYVPAFIEEGRLKDNKLYVFPVAKSTEVIFINSTIFNRFMRDTDVSYDDLKTFEKINETAKKYYEWTDKQTPDIKNDGKTFIVYDSLLNIGQIGFQQLGESFIVNNNINYSSPMFNKVWNIFYEPAMKGYTAIFDGYGSDLAKTGDVVCSVGSTAGVLFYSPTVTYADNVIETVEFNMLPYPIFEGGKKVAMQRGAGMCVTKSTKEKEYAAGIFLKWFTQPEQNLRFISSTGYLPVTKEAFDLLMTEGNIYVNEEKIKKLNETAKYMYDEYEFFIPPIIEDFQKIEDQYESKMKEAALGSKENYFNLLNEMSSSEAFNEVYNNAFDDFLSN